MGNLITTITSIFVPLGVDSYIVPYVFHPYRWGGVPWTPPSAFSLFFVSNLFIFLILSLIGTLSGVMASLRTCNKYNLQQAISNSIFIIIGYIVGNTILFVLPVIKGPILTIFGWLPWANYLIHGTLVAFVIMIFGSIANAKIIDNC